MDYFLDASALSAPSLGLIPKLLLRHPIDPSLSIRFMFPRRLIKTLELLTAESEKVVLPANQKGGSNELVLVLLNGEQPGGLASTSEKFLKAETTPVQMPDLVDTGDPDDYNGLDSSTKDQNDQNTAVRTAAPLIDDLLGDGIGTNLSTSELKNDDDPFADVSFHTTKGKKKCG
ncbi:hypothetical protein GOBAR_DD25657 [Gossypium barbadense]|nr:hypothetical protein GOBAR_DD25657 [Gossypium barbadense]